MAKKDDRATPETPSSGSTDMSFDQNTSDTEDRYRTPTYMPTTSADGLRAGEFTSTDPLTPQMRHMPRRRIMSLELPVFLMFLATLLSGVVMLNQELYQTCVAVFHYNESDCEPLRGIIPKTKEAQMSFCQKMADHKEKRILDTLEGIGMSFEQVTFDTEGNCLPPAYMPTTIPNEREHTNEPSAEDPLRPESKPKVRRSILTLELPVFLIFLSLLLSGPIMVNQELYQTCVAVYHYNETDCESLRGIIPKTQEAKIIEKSLQPYVAKITMTSSILSNVWPGILVLFVGPWSDKFGRRPVLLVTFTALFLGQVITTILVSFSKELSLNPWFYLLASIPSTLVGGGCSMITIVFCYISDVSDIENKAKRMFYVDMAMGLGVVLGNICSSYLLRLTNTTIVCAISATLVFIALMYILFFIGESLDVDDTSFAYKAKHFFDVRLIKDLVKTCATRRPNYGRAIIGCTISILIVSNFALTGELGVFYLFLRNKFNVTLQQFTYYNAVGITIKMVGCAVAFGVFRNLLKISFSAIAMIGLFGCILDTLTRGLAQQFWQMYMAAALGLMSGITGPMLQSIVSLAVPPNEIGKIYSLASCLQTLSPLVSAPLYTLVYNSTLNFYPGLYNFISTGLYVECLCVMVLIYIFERRVKNEETERPATDSTTTQKT